MNPLRPLRREADDFAAVLDGSGTDPSNRFGDARAAHDLLTDHAPAAPRADFAADLRTRLLDAADDLLLPPGAESVPAFPVTPPSARRRERRIGIAAVALVLVGSSAGVAVAAEDSLPGDALYPVKRGVENAKVLLVRDTAAKGGNILDNADTRARELRELVDGGDTIKIEQALTDFRKTALQGSDLIFAAAESTGDAGALELVKQFAAIQMDELQVASEQAPAASQDAFAQAAAALADIDQQATQLCGACSGVLVEIPRVLLQSAESLGRLFALPVPHAGEAPGTVQTPTILERMIDAAEQTAKSMPATSTPAPVTAPAKSGPATPSAAKSTPGTTSEQPKKAAKLVTPGIDTTQVKDGIRKGAQQLSNGLTAMTDTVDELTGGLTAPLSNLLTSGLNVLLNGILGPAALPTTPTE